MIRKEVVVVWCVNIPAYVFRNRVKPWKCVRVCVCVCVCARARACTNNFPSSQLYWHLKVWVSTLDMATCFDLNGPNSACSVTVGTSRTQITNGTVSATCSTDGAEIVKFQHVVTSYKDRTNYFYFSKPTSGKPTSLTKALKTWFRLPTPILN
jgi:hypothetical protein